MPQAIATEGVKTTAEEKESPGSQGKPNGTTSGGGTSMGGVDACLGNRKEGDVENEGDQGNHSS